MKRAEIIAELKTYFNIQELVCPHTYKAFGERSWQFLDTELLETILILRRDIIQTPMIINNPNYSQRGLRCNICQLVKDKTAKQQPYLSSHVNGAGIDFSTTSISAQACRELILLHQDLLPYPIRIEKDVSWVHVDIYDMMNTEKVNQFEG